MALMSTATWRPLPQPSSTAMARYDLVVLHTMVGSLDGTDGYFRRLTNGVNSHFGTGGDGRIYQWVDTAVRSGANAAGNHRSITVENADMGPEFAPWDVNDGSAVPAFTSEQVESLARICAWAHTTHGVPLVAADDSLPGSRGIAFHRLGIDPWRVPGGELWSSSPGKVCPAPRRIAQIPQIIARAQQIVDGRADDPTQEDLMAAIETAVVFASPEDGPDARKVFECSMLTGTRVHVPSPQALVDRKHWLTKAGVPWIDAGEVGRIDAFGVDLVKQVADELQRRGATA